MTTNMQAGSPLAKLEEHLSAQMNLPERRGSFDMSDAPDAAFLAPFPKLHSALQWLDDKVNRAWDDADREALRSQRQHRLLARISIGTGTAAIVLAVLQLTLSSKPVQWIVHWSTVALVLEAVAVVAGAVAVGFGLISKFDRRWLAQRHRAERIRMLKFQSLGRCELWCGQRAAWESWVLERLREFEDSGTFQHVRQWSTEGEVEPVVPPSPDCAASSGFVDALAVYYRLKRLDFQAAYFRRRHSEYQRQTSGWRHLSLPIFFASVLFVLAHFAAEYWAARFKDAGDTHAAHGCEIAAIWCIAAAAVIPVLGFGVRAWFAAFELPRSASLFAAKKQALVHASAQLQHDAGNPAATLRHIAQDEHFLEHEHREWLRLLLETEWFL